MEEQIRYYLRYLRRFDRELTVQEYKTLRGQIVAGEISGMLKGLAHILDNKTMNGSANKLAKPHGKHDRRR